MRCRPPHPPLPPPLHVINTKLKPHKTQPNKYKANNQTKQHSHEIP